MTSARTELAAWVKKQFQRGSRCFYNTLSTRDKEFYMSFLNSAAEFSPDCPVAPGFTSDMLMTIVKYVTLDNPTLFYLSEEVNFTLINGILTTAHPSYTMSAEQALSTARSISAAADRIIKPLRFKNGYKKVLGVHDYLAQSVSYRDDGSNDIYKMHAPLLRGFGVCAGIAKAAKFLLDQLGISNLILSGTADSASSVYISTGSHAWNMVELEGKYYHIDVTFDLAGSDSLRRPKYDYFCLTDLQIGRDHWTDLRHPATASDRKDYHTRNGLYFESRAELSAAFARRSEPDYFTFRLPLNSAVFTPYSVKDIISDIISEHIKTSCSYSISSNDNQMTYTLTINQNPYVMY